MCKQICKELGGDVVVESLYNVGSTFTFTMLIEVIKVNRVLKIQADTKKLKKKKKKESVLFGIAEESFSEESEESSNKSLQPT